LAKTFNAGAMPIMGPRDRDVFHVEFFLLRHLPNSVSRNSRPTRWPVKGSRKASDGTWYPEKPASFHVGDGKQVTVERQVISPGSHTMGGIDLYLPLERKCAGARG
jgi:hypothetical protein